MSAACEHCGSPYQPKRRDAKYCSPYCRDRAWRQSNPEHFNQWQREWRARNRQKISAQAKARRIRNKEKLNAQERARYRANRDRVRDRDNAARLRARHSWSDEGRAAMWQAQGGRCYLCGDELAGQEKVVVDHDHSCCPQGKSCSTCRRGLAHDRCNIAIGNAGDDPARLRQMADTLEMAQAAFRQRRAASSAGQLYLLP